jgi:predicted phosphodiesterase
MEVTLERAGFSFRLIHIPPRLQKISGSGFLLHGHTHVPRDEMIGEVRVLNPGTVGKANKGAPPSYAWLHLGADQRVEWRVVPI